MRRTPGLHISVDLADSPSIPGPAAAKALRS